MFQDHLRLAEAAQDAYLGLRCTLTPQRTGDFAIEIDPDRALAQFVGTLAQSPDVGQVRPGRGVDTGLTRAHTSDELTVSSVEAGKLPYRPKKDDLITIGQQNFRVSVALPGPDGGLQILLDEVEL